MNIFFDTEFTGLHKNTSLVSLGLVTECGRTFYAEFTDYKHTQITNWLEENIIKNLRLPILNDHQKNYIIDEGVGLSVRGDSQFIAGVLSAWLISLGEHIYIWGDCPAYDWVLFCELFGGAMHIPACIFYVPLDLCTFLLSNGYDPDVSRRGLSGMNLVTHNALDDALMVKACWEKVSDGH